MPQSLWELLKLANPKLITLPGLAFPVKNPRKATAYALLLFLSASSWHWCFPLWPAVAWHASPF